MTTIFRKKRSPSNDHVSPIAGDRARDLKNWAEAVENYQDYLSVKPEDVGIWVQLGNCAKESGDFKTSLSAYLEALKLSPINADAHLQIGHLQKLMGRMQDAVKSYRTALEFDPSLSDARHEIVLLDRSMAGLSFLLPTTFLDFLSPKSMAELIENSKSADQSDDPFVKYEIIVKE